jgi:hypothetical protein
MQNGRIQRTFRDGRAVEADFWAGTAGDLRRNAAPFGTLDVRASAGAFEVVLVTGSDISVLETHAR